MPGIDLKWLIDLISNPAIAAIIGALLGPALAGIPWLVPILNIVARLAGYQLTPIVTPQKQLRDDAALRLKRAIAESQSSPSEENAVRLQAAQAEFAATQGGILDIVKDNPIILIAIVGGILFMTMGRGCQKPAPTPVPPQTTQVTNEQVLLR